MAKRRGHGDGAIYQRDSDSRWCTSVDLGLVNGKRRRKVVYGATRKEVAEKLKKLQSAHAAGVVITDRQTVTQWLTTWLETYVQPNRRIKTADGYAQIVRLYLTPHVGRHQLGKLTREHVQTMLNALRVNGGRNGNALSARTVQYTRAVLRRALGEALKSGYIVRNVAAMVDAPQVEKRQPTILNAAQGQHLLTSVAGDHFEALYWVALLLGLREGEILGLRWEDVDFTAHTVRVVQTVKRANKQLLIEGPKNPGSVRTVSLPGVVERALSRRFETQQAEHRAARDHWVDTGLVFTTGFGTPFDPRKLLSEFKAHLAAAGLPEIRFHDLRHSSATVMLSQGIHPRTVMEILGHSQISTTMNTYAHVLPESRRAAAATLDVLFAEEKHDV